MAEAQKLSLFLIRDDKAGHYTQLNGLVFALSKYYQVESTWAVTEEGFASCWKKLQAFSSQAASAALAENQLSLMAGAGGDTWKFLVCAKAILGLKTLVLLRPRFYPKIFFDMIAAPVHDGLVEGGKVLCTEGVLNPMIPAANPDPKRGLILIGGPSRHHGWNQDELLQQLRCIFHSARGVGSQIPIRWSVTTSRRTPESFLPALNKFSGDSVTILPEGKTPPNWVRDELSLCGTVWVTEDSMSMVSEGLTTGIQVGLLSMPRLKSGRIAQCIDNWIARHWVTPFNYYEQNNKMYAPVPPLNEADRVAQFVVAHFSKK